MYLCAKRKIKTTFISLDLSIWSLVVSLEFIVSRQFGSISSAQNAALLYDNFVVQASVQHDPYYIVWNTKIYTYIENVTFV